MENYIIEKYSDYYWKGFFLTDLIQHFNFKTYLELGVATGESWNNIQCELKVGVDSNPNIQIENVLTTTTDEYFQNLSEKTKFDLVFIDACHEKNYAKNDFLNSFNHLNSNGIIVFHDIGPWTREIAQPWGGCGTVYELWIALSDNYPNNTATFEGYGENRDYVGIFFKNDLEKIDRSLLENTDFGYDYFDKNRKKYLFSKKFNFN
jgi:hypothetical protein